jgi:hypothetical protein
VKQIATGVTKAFIREFSPAFKDCLLQYIKRQRELQSQHLQSSHTHNSEANGAENSQQSAAPESEESKHTDSNLLPLHSHESDTCSLLVAPPPTKIIKEGELLKKGAFNTAWKKRMFAALNRADNYAIEYADDSSAKGRINCYGYRVELFDEEEVAKNGHTGFMLVPNDDNARKWYFRCENEAEQNEWVEVFNHACRNARGVCSTVSSFDGYSLTTSTSIERQAFMLAFSRTRSSYGDYQLLDGSITSDTEESIIKYFIEQLLQREMLDDYLAVETSLHSTAASKKAIIASVDKAVNKIIEPIVSHAWQHCLSSNAHAEVRTDIEKSISDQLPAILDAENAVKLAIMGQIERVMHPVLDDMVERLGKCFRCIGESVLLSCEEAIGGFVMDFRDRLAKIDSEKEDSAAMESYFQEQSAIMSNGRRRSSSSRRSTMASTSSRSFSSVSGQKRASMSSLPPTPQSNQRSLSNGGSNVSTPQTISSTPIFTPPHSGAPAHTSQRSPSSSNNNSRRQNSISNGNMGTFSSDAVDPSHVYSTPTAVTFNETQVASVRKGLYYRHLLERELDLLDDSVEKMSTGPLLKTQEVLWGMFTERLNPVGDILESCGVAPYTIYMRFMDTIRCLVRDAVYTYREECSRVNELVTGDAPIPTPATVTTPPPSVNGHDRDKNLGLQLPSAIITSPAVVHVESILNSIILRLCNDAKVRIRRSVIDVLSDLAERTVQEMILLPVASDILKQKAVTQKIPRELRNLLSVYYTGEHLIRTLMDKFFDALISEFMMVTDAKYNDLASMLLDPKFPIV